MRPGDLLICAFVDKVRVGQEFTDWLPHVTIVPWFKLLIPREDFEDFLRNQLKYIKPFAAKVGPEEYFGFKKRANLLRKNQWRDVHNGTMELLEQCAKKRVPFLHAGKLYTPHVTVQPTGRVREGEIFWCDRVYIVEKHDGKNKVITGEIILHGPEA